MPRKLEMESWNRREHFDFFKDFEKPFFNVCVDVDVSLLVEQCRADRDLSFFAATLFLSLKAANEIESLRYRLRGNEVIVHELIHAGSTIMREDQTFGFAYFEFTPDFSEFAERVRRVIAMVKQRPKALCRESEGDDMMYYSVLPWIALNSFSHARASLAGDSVPRIVFGKYRRVGETTQMPLSVEVHHALMDGIHVADFVDRFQAGLRSLTLNSE
jgi:chloramphenicol O-acetyltransferase type A